MAVTFEFTGDNRELSRVLDRTRRQLEALNRQNQKLKQSSKDSSREAVKGFDDQRGSIVSLIGKFGLLTGAVGAFRSALAFSREEANKAIQSIEALTEQRRRLNQVATSPQDNANLNKQADALAKRFGVDRGVARQVSFSARSEGFEAFLPDIIKSSRVVNPVSAAGVAGQVPALFKNQITPRQATNLTLLAAQKSRADFEQIAAAIPAAASGAVLTGTSPAETFALLAVLSSKFKSTEVAGARIQALGTRLGISDKFGGQGVLGGISALESAGPAATKKFLGTSQELNTAFRAIQEERLLIKERTAEFKEARALSGTSESALALGRFRALSDPNTLGQAIRKSSQVSREVARERRIGFRETIADAGKERILARASEEGMGSMRQFVLSTILDLANATGMPQRIMEGRIEAATGTQIGEQTEMVQVLKDIRANTERRRAPVASPEQ